MRKRIDNANKSIGIKLRLVPDEVRSYHPALSDIVDVITDDPKKIKKYLDSLYALQLKHGGFTEMESEFRVLKASVARLEKIRVEIARRQRKK